MFNNYLSNKWWIGPGISCSSFCSDPLIIWSPHYLWTLPSLDNTHQLSPPVGCDIKTLPSPCSSPLVISHRFAPHWLYSALAEDLQASANGAGPGRRYLWQCPWWQVQLSSTGAQPGLPSGQRQWALSSWCWHFCLGWHRLGAHRRNSQRWPGEGK